MILGHQKQISFLKKIFQSKKIPHAFLFSGPEKIGKKKIAFEITSWILGKDFQTHPDFIFLEPKGKISIDEIREFSFRFRLKPISSPFMVGLIDNAHLMTQEAQQCFLKTLEEPKIQAIFILITASPSLLLPTILSRCQKINFSYVKKEEMEKFLNENKNFTQKEKEEFLEIAGGRPGVLLEFFSKPEKKKTFQDLESLSKFPLSHRFQIAKELSEKENSIEILKDWLNYFHYLFLKKIQGKEISAFPYSLEKIKEILDEIQKTISLLLKTNINQRSALEILMLKF